jgi:WD40 repeat protein
MRCFIYLSLLCLLCLGFSAFAQEESPVGAVLTPDNVASLEVLSNDRLVCQHGHNQSAQLAFNAFYFAQTCYSSPDALGGMQLEVMDIRTGELVMVLSGDDGGYAYALAFIDDTSLLWVSQLEWFTSDTPETSQLHVTDVVTGEELATTEVSGSHEMFFNYIMFEGNSRFALLNQLDDSLVVNIWDSMTLETVEEHVWELPNSLVGMVWDAFAISPGGTRLAVVMIPPEWGEGIVLIYSLDGAELPIMTEIAAELVSFYNSVIFSPSGNFVLLSFCDGLRGIDAGGVSGMACNAPTVRWFTSREGAFVTDFEVPLQDVNEISFTESGLMLISSTDGIAIYDVESGEVIWTSEIWSPIARFSADGRMLLTHGDATTLWIVREN